MKFMTILLQGQYTFDFDEKTKLEENINGKRVRMQHAVTSVHTRSLVVSLIQATKRAI